VGRHPLDRNNINRYRVDRPVEHLAARTFVVLYLALQNFERLIYEFDRRRFKRVGYRVPFYIGI